MIRQLADDIRRGLERDAPPEVIWLCREWWLELVDSELRMGNEIGPCLVIPSMTNGGRAFQTVVMPLGER